MRQREEQAERREEGRRAKRRVDLWGEGRQSGCGRESRDVCLHAALPGGALIPTASGSLPVRAIPSPGVYGSPSLGEPHTEDWGPTIPSMPPPYG